MNIMRLKPLKLSIRTIIDRLHDILYQHNLLHGQDLQTEQATAEQKRKIDEADQRKVEKEQLEIQKLRTEIENQKRLDHMLSRIEDFEHKILFHARANTDQCDAISQHTFQAWSRIFYAQRNSKKQP